MKFRISTILWVFALLASAVPTFGRPGILVTLIILVVWNRFFSNERLSLFWFSMICLALMAFEKMAHIPRSIYWSDSPRVELDYAKTYTSTVFVIVSLIPIVNLWKRRKPISEA